MKKALELFGFSVAILLMAVAVLMLLAPRFGWKVDAVFSGSMEPELKVGGLAITRPVNTEDVKVGDIITFYSPLNGKLTSHRVIAVQDASTLYFRTEGDGNGKPDPFAVPVENVVGRVWFHIPYLGYAAQFIKTPFGLLLMLCIPGLIVIALEIRNIRAVLTEEAIEKKYRIDRR